MQDILLFDLDGTIIDPKEGITKCVAYALDACGILEENQEKLLRFIGPPLKDSFCEFYGMDEKQAEFAIKKYRERFSEKGIYESVIYKGMPELFSSLKSSGFTLAVATSKPEEYAKRIIQGYNLTEYFDNICGCEFDGRRSTKYDVIKEVVLRLGSPELSRVLMIGDRKHDIQGAAKAGIKSAGVRWGYAPPGELELAGADYIFDSISQLKNFLMGD